MTASPPDHEFDADSPVEPPNEVPESPSVPPPKHSARLDIPLAPPQLSPRSISASAAVSGMSASSTLLGSINAARRPAPRPTQTTSRDSALNVSSDIMARLKAVQLGRQGAPQLNSLRAPPGTPVNARDGPAGANPIPGGPIAAGSPLSINSPGGPLVAGPGGVPANFKRLPGMTKPVMQNFQSAPAIPGTQRNKPSLAQKRGLALPGGLVGATPARPSASPVPGRKRPGLKLSDMNGGTPDGRGSRSPAAKPRTETMLDRYSEYIDAKTGSLRFKGKAVINSEGVKFAGGKEFSISLDEVDTLDELGKGNYGTVYKVRHSRPRVRRLGLGLAGNKLHSNSSVAGSPTAKSPESDSDTSPSSAKSLDRTSGVVMAMKEIRLELDDAKFTAIIMELDILHRCISPYIVDFYGAFFQEGAVYICMEFMDGGSIDKLYGDGIPENVLRKITLATTVGLKTLKDEHNIIHRDVKPTNILINTRGQVKICDFGVSGNLVASFAKTNIGCQSYMAPERISSGGIAQADAPSNGTYSVQSDIWSLGLTIIECAMGRYPYPPETYNNIFSQLSAIVDGDPPDLPEEGFSDAARNFVRGCLNKIPKLRPTYAMLLQHAWLAPLLQPQTIAEEEEESDSSVGEDLDAMSDSGGSRASTELLGSPDGVVDEEVAKWVREALERRRLGHMGKGRAKPALHAAPLDAVLTPAETAVVVE